MNKKNMNNKHILLPNPLDGDRAAIEYDNLAERNASEKRWDAYYKGCKDSRNHRAFLDDYVLQDESHMYKIGWNKIKKEKL